jgi:hypothetical protein
MPRDHGLAIQGIVNDCQNSKFTGRSKMVRCKDAKKTGRAVYSDIHKPSGFFSLTQQIAVLGRPVKEQEKS